MVKRDEFKSSYESPARPEPCEVQGSHAPNVVHGETQQNSLEVKNENEN
jgi:hypothetical protein